MADPTSWVWYVSLVSRDKMDVGVGYGLPRRDAAIDANVKSLWFKLIVENVFDLSD